MEDKFFNYIVKVLCNNRDCKYYRDQKGIAEGYCNLKSIEISSSGLCDSRQEYGS